MNGNELARMTEKELLRLHGAAINELRRRKVVRTQNNPVGDYTEWLVSRALDLKLEGNSAIGYDAINERGIRYQIKGRRLAQKNHACQLSAIRNLHDKLFHFLAVVVYDTNYDIIHAVLMPHATVCKYATYREHVNAHILHINCNILNDDQIKPIDSLTSEV